MACRSKAAIASVSPTSSYSSLNASWLPEFCRFNHKYATAVRSAADHDRQSTPSRAKTALRCRQFSLNPLWKADAALKENP